MILPVFVAVVQGCATLQDLGRAAYNDRRYEQAAQHFAAALGECGANGPLLLALGQAQLLAGRPEEAAATLARVRRDDAVYVAALKASAKALYLLARDGEAQAALHEAAGLAPRDAEVPYDLGRILYQQGRHAQAAEAFRRALSLDPESHKAWDNLGLAMEALGNPAEARAHYLKALSLVHTRHPSYDVVYANFADLLIKEGDYQRAFDLAAEAAQRNPRDARNLFLAGKALLRLDRPDVGLRWLERAMTLDPDYPEPHYLAAQAYRRLGRAADAERALAAFQSARAKAPARRR